MTTLKAPLGRCYWAVSPFSPEPPFRFYAGKDHDPVVIPDVNKVRRAASKGDNEFELLVTVKPRPVLVITNPLPPYGEVLVLRLERLEKRALDEAEAIRQQQDPALFYLKPDQFRGLKVENAAIISSMLRLPMTAIDTSEVLGELDDNELRVIHERIVDAYELRLDYKIVKKANEFIRRIQGGS